MVPLDRINNMAYKVGSTEVVNSSAQVLSSQLSGALPALDGTALTGAIGIQYEFGLCHTTHEGASNGGCHLTWTVPADTRAVKIELQGGGAAGGNSNCCKLGRGGGTGGYTSKMLYAGTHFTAGSSVYELCAGGTTPCSCCGCCTGLYQCGFCGCPSYANGPGLSGYCANGGSSGWNRCSIWCYACFHPAQNGNCHSQPACGCGSWDIMFAGATGTIQDNHHCWNQKFTTPGPGVGPFSQSAAGFGMDACRANKGCCVGHSLYPSGGGFTPYGHASCCYGGWGAGGFLKVTYWK